MIVFPVQTWMAPEALALLTSQIGEHMIDASVQRMQNTYFLTEVGLIDYSGKLMAEKDFSAIVPFLGEDHIGSDPVYSTCRRILCKLMRRGILSINETSVGFHVWFDASSNKNRAYLRFCVLHGNPCLLSYICADGIDEDVLAKLQVLCGALGVIIRECISPAQKWI